MTTRRVLWLLMLVGVLALSVGVVRANTSDDFAYVVPVSVQNQTGSTLQHQAVCAQVNPSGLIAGGYLRADAGDLFPVAAGGADTIAVAQGLDESRVCWWLLVDELLDGAVDEFELHMGNSSANRDQPIWLQASDSIDIPDADSLDITSNLIVESLGVTLAELPSDIPCMEGGTVTRVEEDGREWCVHTFLSSGTLTMDAPRWVHYLVVGGGGAGGQETTNGGGGGGAGGVLTGTVAIPGTVAITVGAGGVGNGGDGGDSSIGTLVVAKGGGGGGRGGALNGRAGGSGGGGAPAAGTGGSGTPGQGNNGGAGGNRGGGGGGAGEAGDAGIANAPGHGGDGITVSFPGGSVTVGGGGGGGAPNCCILGVGGTGGGGNGAYDSNAAQSGTPNTGGGGGGSEDGTPGNGGSGIVIVWYQPVACLLCKPGSYAITLDGDTLVGSVIADSTGDEVAVSYSPITVGTAYDIAMTTDGSQLTLWVNEVAVASATFTDDIAVTDSTVTINGITGTIGRTRVGTVFSPAYPDDSLITPALDLTYEPPTVSQTQQGDAGNGWTYTGTIEDQSPAGNDAAYTFLRPWMASVTVDVAALQVKGALPSGVVEEELPDTIGELPDLLVKDPPLNFPGRGAISLAIQQIGFVDDTVWFAVALIVGILLGGLTVKKTSFPLLGFAVIFACVGFGPPFGLYSWAYLAVVGFICFGVGGTMAMMGRRT